LRDVVAFPHTMMPFVIGRPSSTRALVHALVKDKRVFLAAQQDAALDDPQSSEICTMGCILEVGQLSQRFQPRENRVANLREQRGEDRNQRKHAIDRHQLGEPQAVDLECTRVNDLCQGEGRTQDDVDTAGSSPWPAVRRTHGRHLLRRRARRLGFCLHDWTGLPI
jgi:ATP-dependent Lon protease